MQRLQTRPQFQAVLAGSVLAKTVHFALHRQLLGIAPNNTPPVQSVRPLFACQAVWMGAMVPKRWAKRAVTRNTIKRQIYAVSADFAQQLPKAVYLVRLRSGFSRQAFLSATSAQLKEAVRAEVQALLQAAVKAL